MEFRSLSVILLLVSIVQAGHDEEEHKPVLTVEPDWPQIFSGQNVTLTCSIPGERVAYWTYNWYRDSVKFHSSDENYYIIRDIKTHHGLKYCCYGSGKWNSYSPWSNQVTLSVTERPKASLILVPTGQMFNGEKVTLRCDIQGHTDTEWRYSWYKDGDSNHPVHSSDNKTEYSFSVVESNSGKYTCRGERRSDSQRSEISDAVTLTVSETPKPELTSSHKGAALIGNPVVLYCKLDQSAGWRFYWSKHTQSPENETKTETHSYTISSVSVSDGGQYWCRAGRGTPVYYTHYSDALWMNVTESPKAVISINPDNQVFRGETVTLRCDMQGGGDTEWRYSWHKDDYSHVSFSTTKENTISFVRESHSGKYTCRGERRSDSQTSEISDAVTLTVSDRAQAVLRSSPQSWLTEGDSVTLSCEVKGSSTGWTFSWYRDKDELLSDSSRGAGGSYTLSPVALNHTGVYACRAMRGETTYHTQYSDTQPLWITGVSRPVSLKVSPSRVQHFSADSLSLSCEGQSDSTGWRVRRYTHREKVSDCSSGSGSVTGSTCSISSLNTSHTGVYWCESESGESSNPVNITVTNNNVILESPVHPVTERDPLTLRCLCHHTKASDCIAEFYKDGLLLQTQTTGEMTIRTVSKSNEGLYHCKHPEKGESPQNWILVRVSTNPADKAAPNLVGVVVGVGFAVLFIILLILLWCYRANKGLKQNIDQMSQQNRQPGAEVTQNGHTLRHADVASGSTEVTYAEIELKTKKPTKKREMASVNADTVYSELKHNTDKGNVAGLGDSD
uniref:Ig-like domain-containing protein n=1 Tax=Pygocentrus nattereri TaxID=42514 RepID=A0A3B4C3Y2_PYGNA